VRKKSSAIPLPFDFWDAKKEKWIKVPLNSLYTNGVHVYDVTKGSIGLARCKQPCMVDKEVVLNCNANVNEDNAHLFESNTVNVSGAFPEPSSTSRMDGDSNNEAMDGHQPQLWLTSSLIILEVMDKDLESNAL